MASLALGYALVAAAARHGIDIAALPAVAARLG